MPHSYAYTRVSTAKQEVGPEVQLELCRRLHSSLPAAPPWGGEFRDEAVSRDVSLVDRPGGWQMLQSLKRGDWLFIQKLDRLGAGGYEISQAMHVLDSMGVRCVFCDFGGGVFDAGGPVGKIMLVILGEISRIEIDAIRSRTKAALAYRKASNSPVNGTARMGYRRAPAKDENGNVIMTNRGRPKYIYVPDQQSQGQIDRLYDMFCRGMSYTAIAKVAKDWPPHDGCKNWNYWYIRDCLAHEHEKRTGQKLEKRGYTKRKPRGLAASCDAVDAIAEQVARMFPAEAPPEAIREIQERAEKRHLSKKGKR